MARLHGGVKNHLVSEANTLSLDGFLRFTEMGKNCVSGISAPSFSAGQKVLSIFGSRYNKNGLFF